MIFEAYPTIIIVAVVALVILVPQKVPDEKRGRESCSLSTVHSAEAEELHLLWGKYQLLA